MLGSQPLRKREKRSPYAGRLVDRDLLCDRQMHGQVQEGIALRSFYGIIGGQRLFNIGERFFVFGVLKYPIARHPFEWCQDLIGALLTESFAKKTPYIVLGRVEHRIAMPVFGKSAADASFLHRFA